MYREKNKTFLLTPRPKQKQKQNIHPQIQQAGDRPIFVRKQQKHNHTHAHTHILNQNRHHAVSTEHGEQRKVKFVVDGDVIQ